MIDGTPIQPELVTDLLTRQHPEIKPHNAAMALIKHLGVYDALDSKVGRATPERPAKGLKAGAYGRGLTKERTRKQRAAILDAEFAKRQA